MSFKEVFKYYKSKRLAPDLSNVICFTEEDEKQGLVKRFHVTPPKNKESHPGFVPVSEWNAYELVSRPGLLFIKNPFTTSGQRYWIIRCLQDYTRKPNHLNLDSHDLQNLDNWWDQRDDPRLLRKLRWATLGYHHDWDTKVYSEEAKNAFPEDLTNMSKYISRVLGFDDFNAEAAIVNFYHMDSTLSGHTDHSEMNLEAPLFSFSFGQSAVFLLGGLTLELEPSAILIQSGDVVVMSKSSRLCYHGVPKILHSSNQPWEFSTKREDNDFWKPFGRYVETSRINLNVRQVLQPGTSKLS